MGQGEDLKALSYWERGGDPNSKTDLELCSKYGQGPWLTEPRFGGGGEGKPRESFKTFCPLNPKISITHLTWTLGFAFSEAETWKNGRWPRFAPSVMIFDLGHGFIYPDLFVHSP